MAALTLVKRGDNFELFTDGKNSVLKVKNVRVSFPACGEPQDQKDDDGQPTGEKAWQITPMLEKGKHDAAIAECRKLIDQLLIENNPDNKNGEKNKLKMKAEYIALKDGNNETRSEYEGHWVISCNEKTRAPSIRDLRGESITDRDEIDKLFYGGCTAHVMLRFWFFKGTAKGKAQTFPKRVCAGFVGAQFVKATEAFGQGRIDDTDAWGSAEEDAGDVDNDDGLGGGKKSAPIDDDDF